MKYLLTIILVSTLAMPVYPQTKPKTKQSESTPTQKEIEALMKEAQQEMENLDPETKRMLDSMGMKLPSFQNLPAMTDQQLAEAATEDGRLFPSRKANLIARLPNKTLSNSELASFVKTTNVSIAGLITPKSKALADKTANALKNDPHYGGMIASAANGMWILGLKEPALYLMGKATEILPNADNYNNYAAYLTMMGAGHMAIPVLENLSRVHKKNSTVLNNLGQAWLQLGDINKATKYLDSAIQVYPHHPQANYSKCLILESQGKTAEAVAAINRSLKHSVTKSKMDKLAQLEKKQAQPQRFYIPRTYFSVSFNLGVYTAVLPKGYAQGVGTDIQDEWDLARQQLKEELAGLDAAIRMADKQAKEELTKIQQKTSRTRVVTFSPHYYRALTAPPPMSLIDEQKFEKEARGGAAYLMEHASLRSEYWTALEKYHEQHHTNECGELPIITKYIKAINTLNETYRTTNLRAWASDAYASYTYVTSVAPTSGVALKGILEIKRDFVSKLLSLNHESYDLPNCVSKTESKKPVKKKLPDYDKVNCKTASSLYVPLTGQIVIRCNEMDVIFNPTFLPVKASWTEDFNADRIQEASIGVTVKAVDFTVSGKLDDNGNFESGKVTVGKNIKGIDVSVSGEFDPNGFTKGSVDLGVDGALSVLPKEIKDAAPVDISLKGKLGAGIELGPDGITDFYVKQNASLDMAASIEADFKNSGDEATGFINEIVNGADVQINAPKVTTGASISADNRVGVNSGFSGSIKGKFSSLTVK